MLLEKNHSGFVKIEFENVTVLNIKNTACEVFEKKKMGFMT